MNGMSGRMSFFSEVLRRVADCGFADLTARIRQHSADPDPRQQIREAASGRSSAHLRTLLLSITIIFAAFQPTIARADAAESDAHAKLDQILHQPEFTAWRLRQNGKLPDLNNPYSDRWAEWVKTPFRAIRDFFKWMFRGRKSSTFSGGNLSGDELSIILKMIAWVLVAAVVIFLGIVLIRIIGSTPQSATVANVLSREQVQAAMESGDALALGSTQWMDEARRLAGEQDFRAVYRALYLALLSGLHSAGKIEHNRNRTNWVYVQHYRGPINERDRFSELTELFDRVWYGRKPAEGSNLEQLRLDVDRLTSAKGVA